MGTFLTILYSEMTDRLVRRRFVENCKAMGDLGFSIDLLEVYRLHKSLGQALNDDG
jgi:hypothetical protein